MSSSFRNVFVGPPWTPNIETWPGLSTTGKGMLISNYYANPLPINDPPTFPPFSPGGWTSGGWHGGGKKRKSKKRKSKKGKLIKRKTKKSIKLKNKYFKSKRRN